MSDATILSLVDAQARARQRVESAALAFVRRLLVGMSGNWYSDSAVRRFAIEASGVVDEAQRAVGGSTAEFLDRVLEEMGVTPSRQRFTPPSRLRKVDPFAEWERPAKEFRASRAAGLSDLEAQARAVTRAEVLAADDVQLGQSYATVQRLSVPKVDGYRRVIHPEVSTTGTCGLSAVASDRVYQVSDLMPVHARCGCGVLPIARSQDPGSALNAADLVALYDAAGSNQAADLKRTRFVVADHSELGPQLLAA